MSGTGILREAWSRLVAVPSCELESGFREVILRLSRKGMHVICLLGLGSVAFYTAAHLVLIQPEVIWSFRSGDVGTALTLWDKLLLVGLSVVSLLMARSRLQGRGGRLIVALLILAVEVVLLVDDVARGSLSNSAIYLVLLMLCGVGTMPYRAIHMLWLCTAIAGIYLALALFHSEMMGAAPLDTIVRRMIPLVIATIICTGIASLLYRTRIEQYRALENAESLRDRLQAQSHRLLELERAKARFFANVSHEFRTPLTLILGSLDDVARDERALENGPLQARIGLMRRGAARLHQLIDQLLDLSRLESGQMALHLREHDLIAFLRNLVVYFSVLADRSGLTLRLDADEKSLFVAFDADKLEKALANLLSNAIKFTPSGGKVWLIARCVRTDDEEEVEISVHDTGSGIAPEELSHVFDRFYQADSARNRRQDGTGIGLSLARELIELHGGSIEAESRLGFGSTFRIRLPVRHVSRGEALPADDPSLRHLAISRRDLDGVTDGADAAEVPNAAAEDAPLVLVVDDNEDMRLYLRYVLGERFRVAEAASGQEGLEKIRSLRPHLVISDVMMPGVDGFALCDTIKRSADLQHIPVVLLTARADESGRLQGFALRADDYLNKPFSTAELVSRVDNLILQRSRLRSQFSEELVISGTDVKVSSAEAAFLLKVRAVIEAKMSETSFGVDMLADEVGYHPRQLHRKLKATLDISASDYIRKLRLERARQLLMQRTGTVAEIAYRVGYHDANHFSKRYKQMFGVPPSEHLTSRTFQTDESDKPDSYPASA